MSALEEKGASKAEEQEEEVKGDVADAAAKGGDGGEEEAKGDAKADEAKAAATAEQEGEEQELEEEGGATGVIGDSTLWLRERIGLRGYNNKLWNEEHESVALDFLTNPATKKLFVVLVNDGLLVSTRHLPKKVGRDDQFTFFLKLVSASEQLQLSVENMRKKILHGGFRVWRGGGGGVGEDGSTRTRDEKLGSRRCRVSWSLACLGRLSPPQSHQAR